MRCALLGLLCLTLPAWAGHDFLGERPPEIQVGGWMNLEDGAENPSLEGLRGSVVILDFWHSTCNRCLAKISKLRTLHEDYAAQGLVVLALSAQNQPTVQDQTPKQKIPYLTAWDDRSEYGISGEDSHDPQWHSENNVGRPETYLLAMDGTVVWQGGTTANLSASMVEEELARIQPLPALEYSESFDKILRDIGRGRFGKAYAAAMKLAEKDKDPSDTEHANTLMAYLDARATSHKELADKAVEAGRYLRASEILEEISKVYNDMEVAEEADALLKTWKKDKAIKNLIEAEKYLQMGKDLKRRRLYDDAIRAFASVIKKAPDSPLAGEAQEQIEQLQQ